MSDCIEKGSDYEMSQFNQYVRVDCLTENCKGETVNCRGVIIEPCNNCYNDWLQNTDFNTVLKNLDNKQLFKTAFTLFIMKKTGTESPPNTEISKLTCSPDDFAEFLKEYDSKYRASGLDGWDDILYNALIYFEENFGRKYRGSVVDNNGNIFEASIKQLANSKDIDWKESIYD